MHHVAIIISMRVLNCYAWFLMLQPRSCVFREGASGAGRNASLGVRSEIWENGGVERDIGLKWFEGMYTTKGKYCYTTRGPATQGENALLAVRQVMSLSDSLEPNWLGCPSICALGASPKLSALGTSTSHQSWGSHKFVCECVFFFGECLQFRASLFSTNR